MRAAARGRNEVLDALARPAPGPTRSLLRIAANPSTAHSSAASSRFSAPAVPKRIERDTSTTSMTVSSRSSTKRLTYGRADARGHVPVDVAHFVAGHVGAHLLELDAAPLEDALGLAREQVLDQVAAADLEPPDLAQQFRGLHQGTRTCSRMRRATSSPSTPSASAS